MDVCVRIRPHDKASGLVAAEGNMVSVLKAAGSDAASVFQLTKVFTPDHDTDAVYNQVARRIVRDAVKGVPGCIFAYGQTGSGKTHTINGTDECPGVLRHAIQDILDAVKSDRALQAAVVYLSYTELYNEIVRDLLVGGTPTLKLMDGADGLPCLANVSRHPVACLADAAALINKGELRRAAAANTVHDHASRSHGIFTITVESRRAGAKDVMKGTLHVVDLAGSETTQPAMFSADEVTESLANRRALGDLANVAQLDAERKRAEKRNREGCHIRRSLLALVRCVTKLADGAPFIPFRDSKLTRLLRTSLEKNSNTAILCTVNPSEAKETMATLRFGVTAQKINRTAATRHVVSDDASMMRQYEREISLLKVELDGVRRHAQKECDVLGTTSDLSQVLLEESEEKRNALEAQVRSMMRLLNVGAAVSGAGSVGAGVTDETVATSMRTFVRSLTAPNPGDGELTPDQAENIRSETNKALFEKATALEVQLKAEKEARARDAAAHEAEHARITADLAAAQERAAAAEAALEARTTACSHFRELAITHGIEAEYNADRAADAEARATAKKGMFCTAAPTVRANPTRLSRQEYTERFSSELAVDRAAA